MPQAIDSINHAAVRKQQHPRCYVCDSARAAGLGVEYLQQVDGQIHATVDCPDEWEGYPGLVHGGIVASLVDGAMTNCLFARNIAAVTADLHVRYRHAVRLGQPATIRAKIVRSSTSLHVLEATIHQNDRLCITATGKFMRRRPQRPTPS